MGIASGGYPSFEEVGHLPRLLSIVFRIRLIGRFEVCHSHIVVIFRYRFVHVIDLKCLGPCGALIIPVITIAVSARTAWFPTFRCPERFLSGFVLLLVFVLVLILRPGGIALTTGKPISVSESVSFGKSVSSGTVTFL